ncbi:MAG: hypothetical protein ACE5JH_03940 [Acidobacteriota bacterium]
MTRLLRIAFSLIVPLATLLPGDLARATSVRRLSLEQMTSASETIVEGRIESVRSFWKGKRIWTEITLTVGRSFKGSRSATLTFLQPGGRVESPVPLAMIVPGVPPHREGERGFYFLQPGGTAAENVVVGLMRGYVPVRRDGRGDYILSGGRRMTPGEFGERIRRALAGAPRGPDGSGKER